MQPTTQEREAYHLGRARLEQGDLEGALAKLGGLLHRGDRYADLHYLVGISFETRGELDEAARSLETALRINPGYVEARLALGAVYEQQGEWTRSRELRENDANLSRANAGVLDATTAGKLANLQAALGDAYREAGDLREAIDAYRKALDRCPEYHDIRHRLGVALREAGLPQQALREFIRVMRRAPGQLGTLVQLGLTHYSMGRVPEAIRVWQEVLRRDSNHPQAQMYMRLVAGRVPTPGSQAEPTPQAQAQSQSEAG